MYYLVHHLRAMFVECSSGAGVLQMLLLMPEIVPKVLISIFWYKDTRSLKYDITFPISKVILLLSCGIGFLKQVGLILDALSIMPCCL